MRVLLVVAALAACDSSSAGWSQQATHIAVGGNAACALESDGQVACWGSSSVLQRGGVAVGPTNDCISPYSPSDAIGVFCSNPFGLRVATDQRFVEITSTWDDTFCGRTAQGRVHCWPNRYTATPGSCSTIEECSKSVELAPGMTFSVIAGATRGFVGVASDGHAYRMQIGVAPTLLPGDSRYTQLRGGDNTWGGIDSTGVVREGDFNAVDPPQPIATIVGATQVAIGGTAYIRNGCALDGQGQISCWGPGARGQLGDGTFEGRVDPAPIVSAHTYKDIYTSGSHVCAVTTTGEVDCWGWNSRGQSGPTAQSCPDQEPGVEQPCSNSPVRIPLPLPATVVRVGPALSCALLEDRTVWCWGLNTAGQLGRGTIGGASPDAEPVQ